MASSGAECDRSKPGMASNSCGRVRIIAKIRSLTDLEPGTPSGVSAPWISVQKPNGESSDRVTISFADQSNSRKESCEIDYCYDEDEDNSVIYSREVKHLISGVFNGSNATVIAYGARGGGKTYTIQGSDENSGLATMAMNEILSMAEKDERSVSISSYEIYQDHVYDTLDPKKPEVLILENGRGKIQLKGLSQVPVKSISEFQKLYCSGSSSQKPAQKIPTAEVPHRSHKGLMVHVSSCYENLNAQLVGKMNFVDLAGYEDVRRKSNDDHRLVESTRINKSIYALHNVAHALNANESHVPYRESKITRMLQDTLGGTNQILMVACLNPHFCQDTTNMIKLGSRSCQGIHRIHTDSTIKRVHSDSTTKKTKTPTVSTLFSTSKNGKPLNVSNTLKKQMSSQVQFSEKKTKGTAFAIKGRKLFGESKHATVPEKANSSSNIAPATEPLHQQEGKPATDVSRAIVSAGEESALSNVHKESESISTVEMESALSNVHKESESISTVEMQTFTPAAPNALEPSVQIKDTSLPSEHNCLEVTATLSNEAEKISFLEEGHNIEKENMSSVINEGSPPISTRLRELSNNLKSLYSSTSLCMKLPQKNESLSNAKFTTDIVEPRTPILEQNPRFNDEKELANTKSPWEAFNARSSGMKTSLVQGYLKFLNTASKEELKGLKGIGEKRATYILELREDSPEPFKDLDDLKDIGLSAKQIKGMMKNVAGDLFT
ncbi:kinesin-like protein KIN-10C [Malania oleifera]|uniref:kinesin-like protein KIN-10C n=1 Tax=Malania oleifera TaxID=397392 RepID=UPI0025AE74FE|nr:kinesin-like protein KIN-10C [Malania oleifera]